MPATASSATSMATTKIKVGIPWKRTGPVTTLATTSGRTAALAKSAR